MMKKSKFMLVLAIILIAVLAMGFAACSGVTLSTKQTVIFNVKIDGEWQIYASLRTFGKEIIQFPQDPTQSGSAFAGWYSTPLYTTGSEVHEYSFEDQELTEEVKLYAKFVVAPSTPYTITFNTNGGKAVGSQEYTHGSKINTETTVTTKKGCTFAGWYRDEELTMPWNAKYDRIWASQTLYAKWDVTGYEITYELDGGKNSSKNPSVYNFTDGLTLYDPTKIGYEFKGWYLDSEFAEPFDFDALYEDDLTIYAKWQLLKYEITMEIDEAEEAYVEDEAYTAAFEKFGFEKIDIATIDTEDPNYSEYAAHPDRYYGEYTVLNNPLTLPTVTKTGYDFTGWFRDEANGIMLDTATTVTGDLDLTPAFQEKKFFITYELEGGTNNQDNPSMVYYFTNAVTLKNPTKLGYAFVRWYTINDLNEHVTFVATGSGTQIYEDITLYAEWSIIHYDIHYHLGTGEEFDGEQVNTYTVLNNLREYLPRATKTDFIFSGWYLDSGLTDRLNLDGVYAQELNLYPAFVANALLDPANYIEVSSSRAITLYASDVATNNICIPMVKDVGVYKVFYDGVEIVPQNFYYDEATNKLIIANDEIDDVQVGMRYQIDVIYDDYTRDVYSYGVHNDSSRYAITSVDPYSKSTSSYLGIQFNSIAYSNIKRVTLDDNAVEYTLSSNKLMIAASIVDLYPVGKCLLQVYTDKGIIAKDITIANSGYYYPYNVSIDIETYPYVYVNFDYDFAADYYIVKIDSLEYSSLDHPELFNGTCFDATGLLKTATQSYSVIAVYGGTEYQTETKEFGYHLYSSKSDANMQSLSQACLENSYTVYGVTANTYITSAEELYDLLFYAALYYDKIDARIEGSGYEEFRAILICLDFDINEQNLLTLSSDYYSQRDSSGNILYEGEGDNKKAIHLDSSKYALDDIEFVLCMIQDVTSLLSEATAYSLALQQFTTSGLIPKQTYKIGIKFDSAMTPTVNRTKENTSDTINNNYYKPDYYIPFYSTTGLPSDYVFPIETQNLGDAEVYTSRELYLALEHGYNPIPKGTALQNLYKEIKKVLKGIVDTDMSQYEQALAIYQWLGTNVYYDHDAAKKAAEFKEYDDAHDTHTYNQVYGWSSYYMEGVFNNKLAVCNGIAAAYSAMLNMMGIPCHKINGTGNGDPHTWNELCIGGYWYISDPTWASGAAEGDYCEVLSFANFLLTYKEAKETYKHIDKPSVYGVSYADDVYFRPGRIMTFVYNTNTYSLDPSYYTASQTVTAAVNYIRNRVGTIQTGEIIEVPIYAFIDPPTITGYKHDRIAAKNDTGFCTIYYTKN